MAEWMGHAAAEARIEALARDLDAIAARLADAEAARHAAHTAELRATDATATARALRDIIDTLKAASPS